MSNLIKISQLPAGAASKDAVVPATNDSGDATQKVKLGDIANITTFESLAYASTINTDASLAMVFEVTLAGNATLAAPTNASNGQRALWRIKRTDGQVLTLNQTFRIINGATIDNTDNATTYLDAVYDMASNRWDTWLYSNKPATVPGAPTSVTAVTNGVPNQIAVAWTAPTFSGNLALTDYSVQYSLNGGVTWTTFSDSVSTATSVTVTGLDSDEEYVFRVAAVNSLDIGPYSPATDPVTPLAALVPDAPTSVAGVAGNSEVVLTWAAPAFTGNVALTDYVVQYSDDNGDTWTTFSDDTGTGLTATVTGLTNDTAYVFRVAAVNSVGTGDYSTVSAAVTPTGVTQPTPTLLLHFDGANGSTTFTDSSLNNLSVVAYNNAAISTTDSKFGGASVYFPARVTASSPPYDGDALRIGPTTSSGYSELVLDDDFTVECWVKFGPMSNESGPLFYVIAQTIWQGSGTNAWSLWHHPEHPNKISFWADSYSSTAPFLVSSSSVTADTWYHVAVTREGNVFKLWINGAEEAAATQAVTITQALSGIGMYRDGQWAQVPLAPNYIDEFRVVNGVAVYTSNFTPPTQAYANPVPPPSLLLHFDGTNGSTTFADSSLFNLQITPRDDAQISTAQSKFGGSSLLLDGALDALLISDTPAFGFGLGDFTLEAWIYLTSLPEDDQSIFDFRTTSSGPAAFFIDVAEKKLAMWYGTKLGASGTALTTSQWYHVAVTRENNVFRCYLNGQLDWQAIAADCDFGASSPLVIGGNNIAGAAAYGGFRGYIDEVRVVTGTAVYTSNFTPPTQPFANPVPPSSLLLHFDGADGASVFTDSSANALTITANGATTSTAESKFGGSSGYFSNTHLAVTDADGAPVEALSFGTGPFTIDFWVYVTGGGAFKNMLELGTNGSYPADRLAVHIYNNNRLTVENTGAGNWPSDPNTFSFNQWVHVAVTRDTSNVIRLFRDGQVVGTPVTDGQSLVANIVRVGKQWDTSAYFNGYMDELRIIKGAAVYTANFTPPTAPYIN